MYGALNASGSNNIAVGNFSLSGLSSGSYNVALGVNALLSVSTGTYNLGLGNNALRTTTTASNNIALGNEALRSNTTVSSNCALGDSAMYSMNYGTGFNAHNVAIGISALRSTNPTSTSSGYRNAAVGTFALRGNTTGSSNVGSGYAAGYSNTTGASNTFVGASSSFFSVSGSANTVVGTEAGYGVSTNSYSNNSMLGYRSGYALTTGSNNILLGYQAGDNITSGGTNIIIGYNIDAPVATSSNQLSIGNLIYATGVDGTGITVSTGSTAKVGIGTNAPSNKLHVEGTAAGAAGIYMNSAVPATTTNTLYNNSGTLYWNGSAVGGGSVSGSGAATRVAFWNDASSLSSNANLYWDDTNARLGIGTTTPFGRVTVESAAGSEQFVARYNSSNPRAGIYTSGSSGATWVGSNLTFSSGNTFNYDKTGIMWYLGNPAGNVYVSLGVGTGVSGTSAGTVDVSTARLNIDTNGYVNIGGNSFSERFEVTGRMKLTQTTAPGTTTDKLYNVSGTLKWNGSTVMTAVSQDASPALGGNLTMGTYNLDMSAALASNQSYVGIYETATVGENVSFGDVLYLDWTTKKWYKAKADSATHTPAQRMAMASITANNSGVLLIEGFVRYDTWSFGGNAAYLSAATAGAITTTRPSTTGNQIQRLGTAFNTSKLHFKPSLDVGEI
jgi:hypothetical protein